MKSSRIASAASITALLAIAVSACGGSSSSGNGVASKSANGIVNAASTAIEGVNTVHVSGSARSGTSSIDLNLDLVNGKGGRGSMSENGMSFRIISVGNNVYINASNAFWSHFGGNAAAQLFHGKWLKAPATGSFGSFASLTNLHSLFTGLLSSHGALSKGAAATINGRKAIGVTDTSKGGTLYVATTGKPYPLEIAKSGSSGGKIDFTNFNESVSLSAPAHSIDISKFK
ncbi:MAG: hypothetical protein ACYCXW_23515 [Solirubrobacteraceae bacterium]